MNKKKTVKQSLEDLGQILSQLETDLKEAIKEGEKEKIKEISLSIKYTKLVISRISDRP